MCIDKEVMQIITFTSGNPALLRAHLHACAVIVFALLLGVSWCGAHVRLYSCLPKCAALQRNAHRTLQLVKMRQGSVLLLACTQNGMSLHYTGGGVIAPAQRKPGVQLKKESEEE